MLMQKTLSLITLVSLASAPSLLLAEGEKAYCPEHLDAEVETLGHVCKGAYAGIGMGTSILDPKFDGTDDELTGKAHLVLPNIYLGYDFNQNWGSELHYTRQGQAKFESGAAVAYSYLGLSGLYHYTLPNVPEVNGFVKLGVGKLMTKLASEPDDGTKVDFEQVKDFQMHFGFGAEYIRLDGLGGRVEWLSSDDDSSEINFTVLKKFANKVIIEEKAPVYFEPEPMVIPEPEPEPVKPEICNAPKGVLEGVDFETGSANLTTSARIILDEILFDLKDFPKVELEVKAYTDNVGSDAANMKLSEQRAASVKRYLYQGGITQIVSFGLGENNPVASNDSKEGRAKNRRVELKILSNECASNTTDVEVQSAAQLTE